MLSMSPDDDHDEAPSPPRAPQEQHRQHSTHTHIHKHKHTHTYLNAMLETMASCHIDMPNIQGLGSLAHSVLQLKGSVSGVFSQHVMRAR